MALTKKLVQQRARAAEVEPVTVATLDDAARWLFPGSPTIRVDGKDIDAEVPTGVSLG